MMFKINLCLLIASFFLVISCKETEIVDVDPDIIKAKELVKIKEYLTKHNYTTVDTTSSGVRYVILEQGSGDLSVDESDIIRFNYTGKTLQDSSFIFDTSIQKVATDNGIYNSSRNYDPVNATFAQNGWTITSKLQYISGFGEGLGASFLGLKKGGKTLILIPSGLAYGTRGKGSIAPNTPLIFELSLENIKKQ